MTLLDKVVRQNDHVGVVGIKVLAHGDVQEDPLLVHLPHPDPRGAGLQPQDLLPPVDQDGEPGVRLGEGRKDGVLVPPLLRGNSKVNFSSHSHR